jgi:hypothetical protein
MEGMKQIDAGVLNVGTAEAGPTDGPAVMEGLGRELKEQADAARDYPQVAADYGCQSSWRSSRPLEGIDRHSGRL